MTTDKSKLIIQFLLKRLATHPGDIVALAAKHFAVTRTTVHRHLTKLINDGRIIKTGTTRNIQYYLSSAMNRIHTYKILPSLSESDIFKLDFETLLKQFPNNIYDILNYSFTEMFNNAKDHSYGKEIIASIVTDKNEIVLTIQDDGIGVFKSLDNYFSLDDLREGALQLSKGKMTTDPSNHTGEGIFFTSRVMDTFEIFANNIRYVRDNNINDWSVETINVSMKGSKIIMRLHKASKRELTSVFMHYQDEESLAFSKTDIIVEMSKLGDETLISRSQAKRILLGLERFKHITLDFRNIRLVGQGFVDEIFRVFLNKFPTIEISYINANDDVRFMIERGINTI